MDESNGDDFESPIELLECASEHIETSEEHQRRADDLAGQGEQRLESKLSAELPEGVTVDVDAEVDSDATGFQVSIHNESAMEIVEKVVDEDVSVGVPYPQQFAIGDPVTAEPMSQRDRIQNIRGIIADIEDQFDQGAPIRQVFRQAQRVGISRDKAEHEIKKLKQKGEVYEPRTDHLRTT